MPAEDASSSSQAAKKHRPTKHRNTSRFEQQLTQLTRVQASKSEPECCAGKRGVHGTTFCYRPNDAGLVPDIITFLATRSLEMVSFRPLEPISRSRGRRQTAAAARECGRAQKWIDSDGTVNSRSLVWCACVYVYTFVCEGGGGGEGREEQRWGDAGTYSAYGNRSHTSRAEWFR